MYLHMLMLIYISHQSAFLDRISADRVFFFVQFTELTKNWPDRFFSLEEKQENNSLWLEPEALKETPSFFHEGLVDHSL